MSVQIQYSCPQCGNTISSYSKKGFQLLHTNIGIPNLKCVVCSTLIRTNHKAFSEMSIVWKTIEIIKISITIIIIAGLFGTIIGFLFGWLFNEYILGIDSKFNIYIMSLVILSIIVLKVHTYVSWTKKTKQYIDTHGDSISSSSYEHPDW